MMRLRAPRFDDAPAVLAVLVARDIADIGIPDFTLEDLRDEWRASAFDLATDAVVVEDGDGRIIAYACVQRPGSTAVVAPDHEGHGVGAQLLQWTERRERAYEHDRHRQWSAAGNERARSLLVSAGYRHVRSYWRMVRQLGSFSDSPALPDGYRLRAVEADRDAETLHAVDAAAFSDRPDYDAMSAHQFAEEHLQTHDFDADLSCVAERQGSVLGFTVTRRWTDERAGFIDILAVHPDHQRRGLGAALLLETFRRIAQAGLKEAQLGVASDNPRALALYENVGMSSRFRFDAYERPVVDTTGPG